MSCEDKYATMQEDIREIFKREKKVQPQTLPVAQPVKGGKRKSRKKKRTRKKQTKKSRKHRNTKTKKYIRKRK